MCAAGRAPNGAQIFKQKCASCHGAKGEGVKDKYAEPLIGDWSVAKLAHYVAANMPEDKPETLAPAEAEAVSRYLYEEFYSRAAQARNHPSRVELAHLTNQQYATTVADLLRRFAEADRPVGPERGLMASYYGAALRGRFDPTKLTHTGLETGIDFDLSRATADEESVIGAEFSMQWRGAVWADETGDHEFILRTPNSVRAWINADVDRPNPAEAVIDANVSTPQNPDHRVTVRLLGGRWYPLGVDYWALPAKAGAPLPAFSLRWKPPHGSERSIPVRNLSPAPVKPTFVVATRFPADDSSLGYERGGAVSKAWDEATTRAAFEVANQVVKKCDQLAGTKPGEPDRPGKIEAFTEKFVAAAFRRPLSPAEKRRYVSSRFQGAPDPAAAITRVVLLALKSPQFLYVELPMGKPDGARVAARLSFGLWDSLPDGRVVRRRGGRSVAHPGGHCGAGEPHARRSADARQTSQLLSPLAADALRGGPAKRPRTLSGLHARGGRRSAHVIEPVSR